MTHEVIRRVSQLRSTATKLLRIASDMESEATDQSMIGGSKVNPKNRIWEDLNREIVLAKVVETYKARRRRKRYLAADLFGEPGWDLLLDLFAARLQNRSISVSSACIAADVPSTTGLRWLGVLEQSGLIERIENDADQRVTWVKLTDSASQTMFEFFEDLVGGSNNVDRDGGKYLILDTFENSDAS